MQMTLIRLIAVASIIVAGCSQPQRAQSANVLTLPQEFTHALRDYESAWQAKDAAALAALFTEDGFVLPNGAPPVRGRTEIERHYTGAGGPLHLRALAWAKGDDIGYIIGEYASESTFANPGKFTLTLKRDAGAGRWLIMSDMDNGNTRPPRP